MVIKRTTLITAAAGLLFLGVSLLMYGLLGYPQVSRVFFFPTDPDLAVMGEARDVPRQDSAEKNVETYVSEWLLGPLGISHRRLFPTGTKLNSVFLRKEKLYLDFSATLLDRGSESSLSLREVTSVVERGIRHNFPRIKTILISVDGEPLPPLQESLQGG
jgi:hypothetical protein